MKVLILDAGPLINLSMNGLLYLFEELKKTFDGKFIITEEVKYEVVDRPIGIEKFELGALRVQDLIDKKVIELPYSLGIDRSILERRTKEIMNKANCVVQVKGRCINIVSNAEMSCLALSAELTKKGIENIIGIDERTTRILAENPQNLESLMSEKLHQMVRISPEAVKEFSEFRFIRSSEIVYVAYKKGLIKLKGNKVLEALLYATKFHGSAISFEEINQLKKL